MKKKTLMVSTCITAVLLFTTCGVFAAEIPAEPTEEVESVNETEELDWTTEQFDVLSDILTGVEDKEYDVGTGHKYDIHMGVSFDKDIVRGVLFNTADIDFNTAGDYNANYFVYFNRDSLIDYMEENGIDAEDFPGLTDSTSDRVMIAIDSKVTINAVYEEPTYEEPVYEEPVYEEPVYEEPVYEEPIYEEPVYEEPVYEEPVYEEPVYEEPVYEEPVYEEPVYEESVYEVNRIRIEDCDGSGHGYYEIQWSDGSYTYEDF